MDKGKRKGIIRVEEDDGDDDDGEDDIATKEPPQGKKGLAAPHKKKLDVKLVKAVGPDAEQPHDDGLGGDEEEEGSRRRRIGSSLLSLRSLLAPREEEPKAEEDEGPKALAGTGPDWTTRYHVVDTEGAATPLEELSRPLHPVLVQAMQRAGFESVFPIQAAVVPLLLRSAESWCDEDSPYCCDVCVSAPTGQGKTLTYALPIVQSLLQRGSRRIRALVLLPTRDLALQVFKVLDKLQHGLGPGVAQVRAACLVGQKSLIEEAQGLASRPPDILVCTPGRLADHYLSPGGTLDLSALRWFVVDEADRLLTQAYHRWLEVLDRVSAPSPSSSSSSSAPFQPETAQRVGPQKILVSATMTWNPQKLAMLKLRRPLYFFSEQTGQHATPAELQQYHVKCSANAKPIALLHLLALMLQNKLPKAKAGSKSGVDEAKAVVFCPSVDTAHRLARLLQLCAMLAPGPEALDIPKEEDDADADNDNDEEDQKEERHKEKSKEPEVEEAEEAEEEKDDDMSSAVDSEEQVKTTPARRKSKKTKAAVAPEDKLAEVPEVLRKPDAICEFSSNLSQKERSALMKRFRKGEVRCLICSDVASRGLDIPEVSAVVNYTTPTQLQTYIHRAGRTARAGRVGHSFTFVQQQQRDFQRFQEMLAGSADCLQRIQPFQLPAKVKDVQQPWYESAVVALRKCFALEEAGQLPVAQPMDVKALLSALGE